MAKHAEKGSNPGMAFLSGVDVGAGVASALPVPVGAGDGAVVCEGVVAAGGVSVVNEGKGGVRDGVGVGPGPGEGDKLGVGVGAEVSASGSILNVPSLTETGISSSVMRFKVTTFKFKPVELPGLPTAWKVTLANIMLPLTPSMFHADILTIPLSLSAFHAGTVESDVPETPVT